MSRTRIARNNGETHFSANGEVKDGLATFRTSHGLEVRATLLHLNQYAAAFELCGPDVAFRMSEVLEKLNIFAGDQLIYSGRAVISGVVHAGNAVVCEAKLEGLVPEPPLLSESTARGRGLGHAYDQFFQKWQSNYRISPEYKTVVADMEAFLTGVRQWLEQVEFGVSARHRREELDREVLEEIAPRVIQSFNRQHERFEELTCAIPQEYRGAHQDFVRRHWHKLFLCSPFGHRTYRKPLGYAGDYEMMDMIYRNRPEGGSLYEKLIHLLLVSQWPAQSVRNRFAHLKENIVRETARVARAGRRARILNIGCGAAQEIQEFLRETHLSDQADFTLLDFNEETLDHAHRCLVGFKNRFHRQVQIEMRRVSVQQLLKRRVPDPRSTSEDFDLIYCAGLLDYLSGSTCRALLNFSFSLLRPSGLIVAANMSDTKPFRNFIEFVLDWQLFYRGSDEMRSFSPDGSGHASVLGEQTSVNLFLHARKAD